MDEQWERTTVDRCPLCAGTAFLPYRGYGDWRLVSCASCSLILLNPRPADRFYEAATRHLESFLDPAILDRREAEVLASADRVRRLERRVPAGTLCDVGAGPGFFMKAAEDAGWRTCGCDPVPAAVKFGRTRLHLAGLRLGTFAEAFPALPGDLDAVTLFHVLEHVLSPLAELRRAARLLRTGGVVCAEVPDIASPSAREQGAAWKGLSLPFHLYFFTPRALAELFDRSGLRLLETGPDPDEADAWSHRCFAVKPPAPPSGRGGAPVRHPARP